ncbi:MAG: lactate 2-monooxygenase [Actinomycetota bacterium]
MAGTRPELPVVLAELEGRAREVLAPEAYDYVAGGAGSEDTVRENLEAFRRWRIVPRHLRNVESRDLSVEVFGRRLPAPVLLAPIGVQGIVHDDAEVAVARAASTLGVPVVLSTLSSKTMEEVAEACGDGPRWYQLYWPNDPELTKSFLSRARSAGFEAVAVTVDTNLLAWRPRDLQHAFLPFLAGKGIANYLSDPVFLAALEKGPEDDPLAAVMRWGAVYPHPTAVWEELAFIKEHTSLPVLLKGILHPDDARRAVDLGMDGIIVSNHGGRQVDGAVATLDALPGVVEAVAGRVPVLLDSGIRTGADALKALALGATAVLLGRPYIWGLAAGGEAGVRHVVRSFLADLDLTMALAGLETVDAVTPDVLIRRP